MDTFLEPTPESGKDFYINFHQKGNFTMLNLLRFKNIADYSNFEDIKPNKPITGSEAYELYIENITPILKNAGSKILYKGYSNKFIVGPSHETWDLILLVEHESVAKFMEFSNNKDFLAFSAHKTAALADSRLLPSK